MRRLNKDQPVTLNLDEETIDCRVVSVADAEATLAPLAAADASYIPSLGRSAKLGFAIGRSARTVTGAVRRVEGTDHLRFVAGETRELAQRRRTARVAAGLTIEVELLNAAGDDGAGARRLEAADVSLGGLGIRVGEWRPPAGESIRFNLALPDGPPLRGIARILRVADGIAGLQFEEMPAADLTRLATFIVSRRRLAAGS